MYPLITYLHSLSPQDPHAAARRRHDALCSSAPVHHCTPCPQRHGAQQTPPTPRQARQKIRLRTPLFFCLSVPFSASLPASLSASLCLICSLFAPALSCHGQGCCCLLSIMAATIVKSAMCRTRTSKYVRAQLADNLLYREMNTLVLLCECNKYCMRYLPWRCWWTPDIILV